jgi:hypothetical protein
LALLIALGHASLRDKRKIVAERILLIEDDARLARMVETYLGEAGFRALRDRSHLMSSVPRLAGRTLPSCWRGEVLLGLPALDSASLSESFVPGCRARFVGSGTPSRREDRAPA